MNGIPSTIEDKAKVIKGPKIDANKIALEGFIKKNKLTYNEVYKEDTEKGKFYFAKIKSKKIKIIDDLQLTIPIIFQVYK